MKPWKTVASTLLVVTVLILLAGFQGSGSCQDACEDACEDACNADHEEEDVYLTYGPGTSSWAASLLLFLEDGASGPPFPPVSMQETNPSSVVAGPAAPGSAAPGSTTPRRFRRLSRFLAPSAGTPGRRLYMLDTFNERIRIFDTGTRAMAADINFPDEADYDLHRMDISPDGKFMFVPRGLFQTNSNNETGQLLIVDLTANRVAATINLPGDLPLRARVNPDGTLLYLVNKPPTAANGTNALTVFDIAGRKVLSHISLPTGARDLDVTPDGSALYVTTTARALNTPSGAVNAQVTVIDTLTSQVATSIDVPATLGTADKVVVSPDGTRAYVTTVGARVNVAVIDTVTNKSIATVALQSAATTDTQAALTSDGLVLFVSSRAELFLHKISTLSNLVTSRTQVVTQPANSTEPKWGLLSFGIVD